MSETITPELEKLLSSMTPAQMREVEKGLHQRRRALAQDEEARKDGALRALVDLAEATFLSSLDVGFALAKLSIWAEDGKLGFDATTSAGLRLRKDWAHAAPRKPAAKR